MSTYRRNAPEDYSRTGLVKALDSEIRSTYRVMQEERRNAKCAGDDFWRSFHARSADRYRSCLQSLIYIRHEGLA